MPQVRLLDGLFKQQAEINQTYLDSLNTDRLLHSFRVTSGLTSTATPYGGWESPDCNLRGHFNGGHYLSAVALAYAGSNNDGLRKSGDTMVAELARCQKAIGSGYVGAFSAGHFEALAAGARQWSGKDVWAPFYTLHKIMAGLVDMYVHTGNEQALAIRRRHRRMGAGLLSGHRRRPAPVHAAHRVRRHERGPRQPLRPHRKRAVPPHRASLRAAVASSIRWHSIATACAASTPTLTSPR